MTIDELKIWLILGIMPYEMSRVHLQSGKRRFVVRALFWSIMITTRRSGLVDWKLCIPLIEKLRQTVWAVVMQVRDGELDVTATKSEVYESDE